MKTKFSQDMFGRLPEELQLQIIKLSPDLSSLWSLAQASSTVGGVLDRSPLEIVEAVLELTVPLQTRRLMRAVLRGRALCFPASLSEARRIATIDSTAATDGTPPLDSDQVRVVRSFLATAENIHAWSHACLDHLIKRSMELRPSTLVRLGTGQSCQETFQRAESHDDHLPRHTGPPSWVEEQRMTKAFWRLQFFIELQRAGESGHLGAHWPGQDVDMLLTSTLGEFYEVFDFERQQILTAYDFFLTITSRPGTMQISLRDNAHGLPTILQTEGTISNLMGPCAEQPSFGFGEDTFHQGPEHLDTTPMSYHFQDIMSGHDPKGSPLMGIPFEPYRKFGFAIWDNKRMIDLGLRDPKSKSIFKNRTFYYFRWRSILTEEELALGQSQ
ncbi:uncharacterized protein CTRU02_201002 [Colletotrichum truncatum]|uniref:Uncharacterized protein n=1 Tax=Colletotrichum truncatum TaxID=5467 RepID=A0ACC3ZG93_COLTU|nr:uncharacterized protein CTRU02_00773 [Colletotrichum truncatum]KAF6802024.1 hypothetical protein CTRU02_00773 [Colletotrichum truncatum]